MKKLFNLTEDSNLDDSIFSLQILSNSLRFEISDRIFYSRYFYIVLSVLLFNLLLFSRFLIYGSFTRSYIVAQYAFSYQKMGFVTRGVLPSILDLLSINNIYGYVVLFNLLVVLYANLIFQLIELKQLKSYLIPLFSILGMFFGIPHFAVDAFRMDLVIVVFSVFSYLLILKNKILYAFVIGLLAILIHEAAIFLLIPFFLVGMKDKFKFLIAVFYVAFFVLIIFSSQKISQAEAIAIISEHLNIKDYSSITESFYVNQVFQAKDSVNKMFETYNITMFLMIGLVYLMVFFKIFKKYLFSNFSQFRWSFVLPLLLCLVGVDWFRWYSFTFILASIFMLDVHNDYKLFFKKIFFVTILIGIPGAIEIKFGLFSFLIRLIV